MDAQYHALPHSPDISQDLNIPSAIEEGGVDAEEIDDSILDEHAPPGAPVDSRIQWIHFMLGSAVLLPWNGASATSRGLSCGQLALTKALPLSHDHRRTLFHLAIATLLYPQHLCLIPRDHVHTLQLYFSRARYSNVKEGMSSVRFSLQSFLEALIECVYRSHLINGDDGR